MTAFAPFDAPDLRRWVVSGAVVVLAHGSIAAAMVGWRESIDLAEPAAAIVIHFAPVPVAPAATESELPPGPEQVVSDASPAKKGDVIEEKKEDKLDHKVDHEVEERIESKLVEELPPPVPLSPNPEVAVAAPPPPQEIKQETPRLQLPSSPSPLTTAPEALPVDTAAVSAAPEQGRFKPSDSKEVQAWQKRVVALLERNKRYPPAAQSRRQRGVVQLFFSIDREGRVIESRVVTSSGAALLDEEALALVRRAQPFPAWPAQQFPGERVGMTVPIRFNLK